MTFLAILNELSAPSESLSRHEASSLVERLWCLAYALVSRRKDTLLVSDVPLMKLRVGTDYSVAQWLNDGDRREEKRFFLALDQRSPLSSVTELLPAGATESEWEAFLDGKTCLGLGLAHLSGGLAVSWAGHQWDQERVQIEVQIVEESDAGELVITTEPVFVPHASLERHLAAHEEYLFSTGRDLPANGLELWSKRSVFFPRLLFLPRTQAQVETLSSGDPHFKVVWERLKELNQELEFWDPERIAQPEWQSKTTPEWETRRKLCWFKDLDGEMANFEWHKRFTPGPGRIHFRLDPASRLATVAHVGPKLE